MGPTALLWTCASLSMSFVKCDMEQLMALVSVSEYCGTTSHKNPSNELVILWIGWAAAQLGQASPANLTDLDQTCLHFWGRLISARLGWAIHVSLISCWDQWAIPRMFFSGRWQTPNRTSPIIQVFFKPLVMSSRLTSHMNKPRPKGGGELWLLCGSNFKGTQQRTGTKGGLKNWGLCYSLL